MKKLTGLDASFVYMETVRTPMHIGSVYLLDASKRPSFSYESFREHIRSRIPLVPMFRKRLMEVPLDLGSPFWIDDPDFDLDAHLPRVGCPRPGGKRELMELAAQFFARPLNRTRPLWEITFVDGVDAYPGLPKGSYGLISRVHHAAVDGVSGTELMGVLLDLSPEPRSIDTEDDWEPEPVPKSRELFLKSYSKLGRKPMELARFIKDLASGGVKLAGARRDERIDPPTLPMRAPRTPLNSVVSTRRVFGGVEFELDDIKALRAKVPGSTVNDVVLAICSGALRTALLRDGTLPEESLIAMAPISVRNQQSEAGGNQVSAMLVEIATNEPDPLLRLQKISRATRNSKTYSSALPAERIMEFVPSATAALAARLYTNMRVAEKHRPFFNLVITNVPGPPMTLYYAGARLHSVFGTAPVFDGLGLILVVFSHAGHLSIGITAAGNALSDVEQFEHDLQAAHDELAAKPDFEEAAEEEPGETDESLVNLRSAMSALEDSISKFKSRK